MRRASPTCGILLTPRRSKTGVLRFLLGAEPPIPLNRLDSGERIVFPTRHVINMIPFCVDIAFDRTAGIGLFGAAADAGEPVGVAIRCWRRRCVGWAEDNGGAGGGDDKLGGRRRRLGINSRRGQDGCC